MRFRLASIVVLAALMAGCGPERVDGTDHQPVEAQAIDGATILVEGERLRLGGIDVPRLAPQARCWAEALLAREARTALQEELSIPNALEIAPATSGGPDVVRVFSNGKDLSLLLLERGLAAPTSGRWNWCDPINATEAAGPRLNYPITREAE